MNALGPMIGSLFVLYKMGSLSQLKQMFQIQKWGWFLFVGTSPIWMTGIIYVFLWMFGRTLPNIALLGEVNFLGNIGIGAFFLWIATFGVGEEIGWRGFLLPELLKKYTIVKATIIVWVLWTLWHLPTVIIWHACFDLITASTFGEGTIAMILSMVIILVSIVIFLYWLVRKQKVIS